MKSIKQIFALFALVMATVTAHSQSWTTASTDAVCTNGGSTRFVVKANGTVWVGNGVGNQLTNATIFYVDGAMKARELVINLVNWPDYVFDSSYVLMPLDKVSKYIDTFKHLPNVPSKEDVITNGLSVGHMNEVMMRKIEELQLYILELNVRIKELEAKSSN